MLKLLHALHSRHFSISPLSPFSLISFFLALLVFSPVQASSTVPEEAELYFISPVDGARVENPVVIKFGLKHMGIAPAGTNIQNTGHHHLIVDAELPPFDVPIPNDVQHLHFGKGQTETELMLSPGTHTLQLLLGDFGHVPHQPPVVSEKIRVVVK